MIKVRNLAFQWRSGGGLLLDIEHLEIGKGERLFLRGASGSGKSTFMSLLAGINVPQSGSIVILDQTINDLSAANRDAFRADHIGYIFQMFNLVPYLSVIENVTLPCQFSKYRRDRVVGAGSAPQEEAMRLLERLGLSGKDVINQPVTELSVGQQQRVAACRALIGRPELIIADEPTSALDTDNQRAFIELLSEECRTHDTTLVFVSHDAQFSALFDRSIILKEGRLEPIQEEKLMHYT